MWSGLRGGNSAALGLGQATGISQDCTGISEIRLTLS